MFLIRFEYSSNVQNLSIPTYLHTTPRSKKLFIKTVYLGSSKKRWPVRTRATGLKNKRAPTNHLTSFKFGMRTIVRRTHAQSSVSKSKAMWPLVGLGTYQNA